MTPNLRCPKCGDPDHIYARADARWDPLTREYIVTDVEDTLDCTECDAAFTEADAHYIEEQA